MYHWRKSMYQIRKNLVFGGCITVFARRHAVCDTEKSGQCGTAWDTRYFADDSYWFIGVLQQSGYMLQAVTVDKVAYSLAL